MGGGRLNSVAADCDAIFPVSSSIFNADEFSNGNRGLLLSDSERANYAMNVLREGNVSNLSFPFMKFRSHGQQISSNIGKKVMIL